MLILDNEPTISVGLVEDTKQVSFEISGEYLLEGTRISPGQYKARADTMTITLLNHQGTQVARLPNLHFIPASIQTCFFTIIDIKIGKDFHWERFRNQKFQGELSFAAFSPENITVINRIPLEKYLGAVICSEMGTLCPEEFLKAHCVVSRSWVLTQLERKKSGTTSTCSENTGTWTDSRAHQHFDVCADDHCQRYHGIGPVNTEAQKALRETRGEVLVFENKVCDTRFSKCCGGITESFFAAWEDHDVPYLTPVADCTEDEQEFLPPVSTEQDAKRFICSSPRVYCNINDKNFLARILPDFDFETQNFFRWQVSLSQEELAGILFKKTGIDFGNIKEIIPLARGSSGRIYKIKINGEKQEKVFGKELEIRRILSNTHLYSSAFVVEPYGNHNGIPEGYTLKGAGWGHGVGLCQIGTAVMAAQGDDYKKILYHYFREAELEKIY
jgi:SpoIID/LytB domain protein